MKKLCTKLSKKEWRVTIPNLTSPLTSKKLLKPAEEDVHSKHSSGFYDFQEAQLEFDKGRSLPTSIYVPDSASSSSSGSDEFQDARTQEMSTRTSAGEELYVEVPTNIDANNGKYEYDVPKISFKFFERKKAAEAAVYENEAEEPVLVKHVKKSEIHIVLQEPEEAFNSQSVEIVERVSVGVVKSGSDPNVRLRSQPEEDDDGFYKVPRTLNVQHRLSQSLKDFDETDAPLPLAPSTPSIEHISCSQFNIAALERPATPPQRRRFPHLSLKPPQKAVAQWNHFKNKMSHMIAEQAAQQRVGAFGDRDKVALNLEGMYRSSKRKCRKVFENTGRMFNRSKSEGGSAAGSCAGTPVAEKPQGKFQASDIEYQLNISEESVKGEEEEEDDDFSTIKSTFKKKLVYTQDEGQNGFEDLRRYVKQGGDFGKELAAILQERAEAETQYAKNLSKLSTKLSRACRDGVGGLNDAWKSVAQELESKAEAHRVLGHSLLEEAAKPLKNLTENQHRIRKQCETQVEKAARLLGELRASEAKGKKNSHACSRDNEKLQDAAVIDTTKFGKQTLSKSTSLIQLAHRQNSADKENAKLEVKKKKAEDAVKKADVEYYSSCVKAERARLEWESAVFKGVATFQGLEDERLKNLKTVLSSYLRYNVEIQPRIIEATERLKAPIEAADPTKDLLTFQNLRHTSQQVSEQLLPDFYCEHITLAMNRERRKQALIKLLHLIRQDLERERRSKNGLENLSKAIKQTPNFGSEDSQQSVVEKLYHMKSMLTYLEGARYKVQSALAELDSRPRTGHPLAPHITITRDKSGLQQSVLKVPQWLREEFFETDRSPVSEKSVKSDNSDPHVNEVEDHQVLPDWTHRGNGDGNSNQPDSDFDEFSSECSSTELTETENVRPIAKCQAIFAYTPNLSDELSLRAGDVIQVYRQQDDGWWLGECNGNVGIFPATYVKVV